MHPQNLSISDFNYVLPEEKIPAFPLEQRDASRLLIYENGKIVEDRFSNLKDHLTPGSLLVFNKTKVVPARILFKKPTGGVIELFCLEPDDRYADITKAMSETTSVYWKCLVGGASKWKHGYVLQKTISFNSEDVILHAEIVERKDENFIIRFLWHPSRLSFAEILQAAGAIPLPPYIKREAIQSDMDRYQTVYAETDGSVAAPTAGLHFTENIFASLSERSIHTEHVTLHVGAGTFKPVKADQLGDHVMHAEWLDVSKGFIQSLIQHLDKKIVAVGTTSMRTIESLYWLGKKMADLNYVVIPNISQWEPYENTGKEISPKASLNSLIHWMDQNGTDRIISKTSIIIAPGYKPRIAKGLITNFHQPRSTLLLLVAALIGDDWKKVYEHALKNNFRFLSYGDGSLLWW